MGKYIDVRIESDYSCNIKEIQSALHNYLDLNDVIVHPLPQPEVMSEEEIEKTIKSSALNADARAWAYQAFVKESLHPDRKKAEEYNLTAIKCLKEDLANKIPKQEAGRDRRVVMLL